MFSWFKKKEIIEEQIKIEIPIGEFESGQPVFVRGNEPDSIFFGNFSYYHDNDGKWSEGIPVVIEDGTNIEHLCMGITLPIEGNEALLRELTKLPPIEQWNALCKPHGQMSEKYGEKYRLAEEFENDYPEIKKFRNER